jgi:hypothetical protein
VTTRSQLNDATAVHGPQEILLRRAVVVLGLLGIALIHLIDLPSKLDGAVPIGLAYIALIVSCLVVAETLVRRAGPRAWSTAAALAAATICGYVVSRTTGLPSPGGSDDIGNWGESLGIASLFVEGAVVLVSISALLRGSEH